MQLFLVIWSTCRSQDIACYTTSVWKQIASLLQLHPYWEILLKLSISIIDTIANFLPIFLFCIKHPHPLHISLFTVWQKFAEKVSKWWVHSRCWIKQALFSGPWEVCTDQRNPGDALQMTCSKAVEDKLVSSQG